METDKFKKVYGQAGAAIRKARTGKGLTLEELADKCRRNWSFISQIERGRSIPSIETLTRICEVLEIPLSSLFSLHKPLEYKHDALTNKILNLLKDAPPKDKKVIANYLKYFLRKK